MKSIEKTRANSIRIKNINKSKIIIYEKYF